MKINKFLYEHPVFTYQEFKTWKAAQGIINNTSLHLALQYYMKNEKILKLRRQLYAVIPPNLTSKTLRVDPYLIAAKASANSILAYHTALELHGVAYSSFARFTFLTHHKVKPFEIANQLYQPVTPSSALLKHQYNSLGVEIVNRQGVDIKITNMARTFVDVLDRIDLSGGLEEVYRSVENMAVLDVDQVIKYCLIMRNARLAAKVGYFLEQRKGAFAVSEEKLKLLLTIKPKASQYLSNHLKTNCRLIKKWNLMMPEQLLNKSWEEPSGGI